MFFKSSLMSLLCCLGAFATSDLWRDIAEQRVTPAGTRHITPDAYRMLELDIDSLTAHLLESGEQNLVLMLPLPHGGFEAFEIWEAPVMAPELAARYPEIRTFTGQGQTDPSAWLKLDVTPHGFHAQVLAGPLTFYIDPYQQYDRHHYISYYRVDYSSREGNDFQCDFSSVNQIPRNTSAASRIPIEGELLTYRVAIAATGEYTAFHGGTVQSTLAEMATAMNRVNGIYERETSITMELIGNNDLIVYTNAGSDPYTNNSGPTMLGENQTNLDNVIGDANYDIGHVFSTGGGGIASLQVPCRSGVKARGVTGLGSPVGDVFYVDYVAHEMGHQYGAFHTFNGTTSACGGSNRSGSTAYEPGSASTIMGYAGICGSENIQNNSDDYFHAVSYDQIVDYTRNSSGNNCAVITNTSNDAPTVMVNETGLTIPANTPFALSATANDTNGDTLTYCWEQWDLGNASPPNTDDGTRPIFRSFDPTNSPIRTFPRLSDILNNTSTFGESLPTTTRELNFRVTVRDNNPAGGGVNHALATLAVTNTAGPFQVTAPNQAATWTGGENETITWDVANTDAAPVSCANVDILLSVDGGQTFDVTIIAGTPNDGTETITVPNMDVSSGRIKVVASDNIFFDINDAGVMIQSVPLICTTDLSNWGADAGSIFSDSNGNGVIDVLDLITCLFD